MLPADRGGKADAHRARLRDADRFEKADARRAYRDGLSRPADGADGCRGGCRDGTWDAVRCRPLAVCGRDTSDAATKYNISALGTITIKWEDGGFEEQLERIITQKWIAMFPNGQEAWSEFRRTGYPRIFPVRNNQSTDINTETQIRRVIFPQSEYSNNLTAVNRAISLLGGPDSGATKLWWDKK